MKVKSELAEKLIESPTDYSMSLEPGRCRSCGHPLNIHTSEGCQLEGCPCGHQKQAEPRMSTSDERYDVGESKGR